ncbi:MAG: hypothetical protein ACRCVQ_07515 [Acinetobacter ursingii]
MRCLLGLDVHGGIRHLENHKAHPHARLGVHGGIRHLEKLNNKLSILFAVHGGIRHLEISIRYC